MSSTIPPHVRREINFDRSWIERIILKLADMFHIRIVWDKETAIFTGVSALAGGLVGGYTGGKMGAALGAGIGAAAGYGVATVVSLRNIWADVKEKLEELIYIVFNYLRRLNPEDYIRAYDILMASLSSRRELVKTIVDFIVHKLGREVIFSITAA